MKTTLSRLYHSEAMSMAALRKAVSDKGWITEDDFREITGEAF